MKSKVVTARFRRSLRLGLRSLWLHRLRSLLTVLGIVFGVCSVIAMLAIGEGASYAAQEEIKKLGSQNVILQSIKPPEEEKVENQQQQQGWSMEYGLKHADLRAIRATIPDVELVVPARIIRQYVWNISRRVDVEVVATVSWYPTMRNHGLEQGRFFTDQEYDSAEPVCVLGHDMAHTLFPLESPLGRDVRLGTHYYRVIGVMEPRAQTRDGAAAGGMQPAADRMFISLEAARRRYGAVLWTARQGSDQSEKVELHEVTVKVARPDRVQATAEVIEDLLKRNHKKKDYKVTVPLELLRQAERTKQIFNLVLGSIAAISLIVGGIGIMNIMLATVTERTREIGIRRALGARRQDITTQFLIESVMLSGAGGLLGVVLGVLVPFVVTRAADMKTIITPWSPILAFTISACVGVVFGLYPALRAARMDPVEALRHE